MSFENVQDVYPLSPMQEGMLFHSLQAPQSGVFVEQLHADIKGKLNLKHFQRAWATVVLQHAVLRTSIHWAGLDEPLQVVNRSADLTWKLLDWQSRPIEEQERAFQELLEQDRRRGFELSDPPAMRMHLIQTGESEWKWLWSFHHILLDGWSGAILRDEVLRTYRQLHRRETPQQSNAPPFRDYIAWLQSRDHANSAGFWKDYFSRFYSSSRLVADSDSGTTTPSTYHQHHSTLSPESSAGLAESAKRTRVTQNTFIQAAWALTVAQHSEQQDVCFGVTLSGRSAQYSNIEHAVGLFITTLPLRVRVDLGSPLQRWLQAIQTTQSSIRDHEHCSLASIQKWVGRTQESLFDSILVFENYPSSQHSTRTDLDIEVSEFQHIEQSNYPIALLVVPGEKVRFILIRDGAQVSERLAHKLLQDFQTLLQNLISAAGQDYPLDVPCLSEALSLPPDSIHASEAQHSPCKAHPDQADSAQVLGWIEEQVSAKPDHTAVEFESTKLSYRSLNEWSNRIANHLLDNGVQAGDFVGLCLQPSLEMMASLLGILKTGAAYVPLDPAYPAEALVDIVNDAKLEIVLTSTSIAPTQLSEAVPSPLFPHSTLKVVNVEHLFQSAHTSNKPPERTVASDNFAYMIYTSGSTGKPKGVAVTHANLDYSTATRKAYYSETPDRFLLMSSVSFDSSIAGIFWTFASGGTLVLTTQDQRTNAATLAELVETSRATHTLMLPSLYEILLDASQDEQLASLRCVIVAGESCFESVCNKHFATLPDARLFNEYGPTEATVWCTVQELSHSNDDDNIPIGKPIAGTEVFVADALGRPVQTGSKGEICVAGPGVVRGYWQRPTLTDHKFFTQTDGNGQWQLAYRTGDIGFAKPSGALVFCGRKDHQVKIRGFRVELRALETELQGFPDVEQVHVSASQQGIVAHVVSEIGLEDKLRERMAASFPEFMRPLHYHFVNEFPRLPNGKTDFRTLEESRNSQASTSQSPRTETEKLLHDIWCQVLGLESISVHDNFFDLGGDSLTSMRVLAQARNAGLALGSPAQLIETGTIASLAEKLGEPYSEVLVRFNSVQTSEVLVLIAAGGVDATYYRHLASHFPDITVVGLQSRGLNGSQPHKRIEDIASDFIAALKNLIGSNKEFYLVGRCVASPVSLEMANQLEQTGTPAQSLTILDSSLKWLQTKVNYQYYYDRFHNPFLACAALTKFFFWKRYRWCKRKLRRLYQRKFSADWEEQNNRRNVQAVSMVAQDHYQSAGTHTPLTLIRSSEYAELPKKNFHVEQWQKVALGGLSLQKVEGEHLMMLKEPMVADAASIIKKQFSAAAPTVHANSKHDRVRELT